MRFLFSLALMASFAVSLPAASAERFTVLLDWFINPDHGALVVAKQRGYFEKAGLNVALIEPADPNAPPKLLAAGQGDVAISYQPQLYLLREADLPVRAVGVLVGQPLNSLVALEDGPVQGIADLKGKKVGYSVGGFETAVLGQMLEGVGLRMDDVELVNINFALTPALLSQQVAAVIGAFRNFELNQLSLNDASGLAFFPEDHGVPAYDELIVLAQEGRVQDPQVQAFLQAVERAARDIADDPDGTWEDFIKEKDGLDDALNALAWRDTAPLLATSVALDTARYQAFADFMVQRGLIEAAKPVSAYIASN
jgi:putative hydroxymethylpyrimidine transport system substrate-binding protein